MGSQLASLLDENRRQGGDNQRVLAENRDLRTQLVQRGDKQRSGAADGQRNGGGDTQRMHTEMRELRAQLQAQGVITSDLRASMLSAHEQASHIRVWYTRIRVYAYIRVCVRVRVRDCVNTKL